VVNYVVYIMKNFSSSQLNGIYKMCWFELLQLANEFKKYIFTIFFQSIRYQT